MKRLILPIVALIIIIVTSVLVWDKKKANNPDSDVSEEEKQLNDLVYQLYEISPDEQKLIKQKLDSF